MAAVYHFFYLPFVSNTYTQKEFKTTRIIIVNKAKQEIEKKVRNFNTKKMSKFLIRKHQFEMKM